MIHPYTAGMMAIRPYVVSFKDTHGEVHVYSTSAQSEDKARSNVIWRIGKTVTTNNARIVAEGQKYVAAMTGSPEYKKDLLTVKPVSRSR